MKSNDLRELVALSLVPRLGAQRIKLLLEWADHPREIFRMSHPQLKKLQSIGPATADSIVKFNDWDKVDKIIRRTERIGAQIITLTDEVYPERLRQIYDPPLLLWVKGDPGALNKDGIAVVGTRRASSYGKKQAEFFSRALVEQGLSVISGLAYGIDSVAHKTTVKKQGTTVAVLGSGIDVIYPSVNSKLATQIAETGGAVISEFPLGTKPDAVNFPVRNRIVSGMSMGTLVVESGREGGSMITARSALDQNREVFVIPHCIGHINGEGCNYLIKSAQGKLVQHIDDILNEISFNRQEKNGLPTEKERNWKNEELDETAEEICRLLENGPHHVDDLSEKLEIQTHELLSSLLTLEMLNCVDQKAGKIFELK